MIGTSTKQLDKSPRHVALAELSQAAGRAPSWKAITVIVSLLFASCLQPAIAQPFAPPQPPPIGDGPTPAPVIPGDGGGPPPVPTGQSDPTPGHNFPVGTGSDRGTVYMEKNGERGNRGKGTIRGSSLTPDQLGKIQGILGTNMSSGEPASGTNVSDGQLEQIQDALAPYPQAQNSGGRKKINNDAPGQGYPKTNSLYGFTPDHPLPTVWTFSRYLVILGCVSATIFMALAAWSMIMGNPYGASRVIGAAAGLMLLLSGYTIWKIVQMNTYDGNSDNPAENKKKAGGGEVPAAFMFRPPGNAGGATSQGRSGVPVQPLGNANNP